MFNTEWYLLSISFFFLMLDFIWIQTYKTFNQVVYHPKSISKKGKNSHHIPLDYQLINEESPCPTEELI